MITFSREHVVLVSGASSGIGKATALLLSNLGATVIAAGRHEESLSDLKNGTNNPDAIMIETRDLMEDQKGIPDWVASLAKRYGKLRGLVLSAGEQQLMPLCALSLDKAKHLFDLNYFSNIALCQGFCDRRVNAGRGSSIVIVSSIASITATAGIVNYSATKGAVNAAMRSLAAEYAKDGIRVNAVLPGLVRTALLEKNRELYAEDKLRQLEQSYPLGLGRPEDVAQSVVFLLSDAARWITGSSMIIDGGKSIL